jgi:hypothetical protein
LDVVFANVVDERALAVGGVGLVILPLANLDRARPS